MEDTAPFAVHIRKTFTWWPKRDIANQRWIIGKAYRNQFGEWLHPEIAAYKLLQGKVTIIKQDTNFYREYH